jgi:general secretion pathway protein A
VLDYIDRRLLVAAGGPPADGGAARQNGSSPAPLVEFTAQAVRAVAAISKGVPRVINTLCDRSLEIAFERATHAIDRSIVREAARRLKLPVPGFAPRFGAARMTAAVAAVALAAALGLYWWLRPPSRRAGEAAAGAAPAMSVTRPAAPANDVPADARPPAAPPAASGASAPAAETPAEGRKDGSYEIAVAAFKTERRAAEVTASLAGRGLSVSTRNVAGGAWYQVVVGPFATSADAEEAQRTLAREGFGDTRVSPVPPGR